MKSIKRSIFAVMAFALCSVALAVPLPGAFTDTQGVVINITDVTTIQPSINNHGVQTLIINYIDGTAIHAHDDGGSLTAKLVTDIVFATNYLAIPGGYVNMLTLRYATCVSETRGPTTTTKSVLSFVSWRGADRSYPDSCAAYNAIFAVSQ